jgi:hypothetical protein
MPSTYLPERLDHKRTEADSEQPGLCNSMLAYATTSSRVRAPSLGRTLDAALCDVTC